MQPSVKSRRGPRSLRNRRRLQQRQRREESRLGLLQSAARLPHFRQRWLLVCILCEADQRTIHALANCKTRGDRRAFVIIIIIIAHHRRHSVYGREAGGLADARPLSLSPLSSLFLSVLLVSGECARDRFQNFRIASHGLIYMYFYYPFKGI